MSIKLNVIFMRITDDDDIFVVSLLKWICRFVLSIIEWRRIREDMRSISDSCGIESKDITLLFICELSMDDFHWLSISTNEEIRK